MIVAPVVVAKMILMTMTVEENIRFQAALKRIY